MTAGRAYTCTECRHMVTALEAANSRAENYPLCGPCVHQLKMKLSNYGRVDFSDGPR